MIKLEATAHETFVDSIEPEFPGQKSFQLQTILKDASPETLESSVEQGVKLLESLKKPMVNKIADTPDAKQWITQIGKCGFSICYRRC